MAMSAVVDPFRRLTLRAWREFFARAEFGVPQRDVLPQRISSNLVYFKANYAFISSIFFLYLCYSLPMFVLIVPGTFVGYSLLVARTRPFAIANHTLLKAHALLAFVTFCALISLIFGGFAFVGTIVMSALVVVAHAALRQRPTNSKALNFIDLWNGVSPAPGAKSFDDEESDEEDPGKSASVKDTSSGDGNDQQQFRAQFRAKMRQKYLNK